MKWLIGMLAILLLVVIFLLSPNAQAHAQDVYRQWESVDQFTEWYQSQNFTVLMPPANNCGDYARWVQVTALRQGYAVSQQLVDYRGEVYGVNVGTVNHVGNLIIVDKKAYYIEPVFNKFKVQFITNIK